MKLVFTVIRKELLVSDPVPAYVFDLLDAFLYGKPLNFKNHPVPYVVEIELKKAVDTGVLGLVPLERKETNESL